MTLQSDAITPARRPTVRAALRAGLLAMACLPSLGAAQLTPAARQEIDALLRAVGSSGCEFMRGGTAYSAAKAHEHLQQKFAYLDARGQLKSAEDFIAKAATRSSMTGEPYGIRCAGANQQASDVWLQARLKALRPHAAPPPHKHGDWRPARAEIPARRAAAATA